MVALCERDFKMAPEDRAEFLIQIDVMHVIRETETRERRSSRRQMRPQGMSLWVCVEYFR